MGSDQRLQAKSCGVGAIDVYDARHPENVIHLWVDEFAEFVRRAKAGEFDGLYPDWLAVEPPSL